VVGSIAKARQLTQLNLVSERHGAPQDRPRPRHLSASVRSLPFPPSLPPSPSRAAWASISILQLLARCHKRLLRILQARLLRRLNCPTDGKPDPILLITIWYPTNSVYLRLPQWEGVQRKWYFVQRATGKSQWEIPTEPVVLTPSTTPTSIGTGPTYPPSRPSTNSPQVTGTRTTLAERIEPFLGSARVPVGNRDDIVCTHAARIALMAG
jgi:hypothetical protein